LARPPRQYRAHCRRTGVCPAEENAIVSILETDDNLVRKFLERQIGAFVDHDNNQRYHESLSNLTPADVYHGRCAKIQTMREEIEKQTLQKRRWQHKAAAA